MKHKHILMFFLGIAQIACLVGCTDSGKHIESSSKDVSGTTSVVRPAVSPDGKYNIMDFGAAGDGIQDDTAYIQEAADMCKEAGGGTIIIPAGMYLCASVRLYSNTTVVLEEGAEILVSDDESKYGNLRGKYDTLYRRDAESLIGKSEDELGIVELSYLQGARGCTDTLFFAQGASNIEITGPGKINGQWKKFFVTDPALVDKSALSETELPRWRRRLNDGIVYEYHVFRPQIMEFLNCTDIDVNSITIDGSPYYNVHLVICRNINISNITILSDIHCPNTDGINLYNCVNVDIRDCYIMAGDDCIALSGNTKKVTIDNVTTKGSTCFIRVFNGIDAYLKSELGIGSAAEINSARLLCAEDIKITNSKMEDGGAFLMAYAAYGTVQDIYVDNVSFKQIMGGSGLFLCIQADGEIKNINVNKFNCEATGAATIMGNETPTSIQNVSITNSKFYVKPRTKMFGNGMPDPVPQYFIHPLLPYNFYIRHASNIKLQNVEIAWGKADLDDIEEVGNPLKRPPNYNLVWREDMNPSTDFPAIDAGDVTGLTLHGVKAKGFGSCEALRLRAVKELANDSKLSTAVVNDGLYDN